MRIRILALMAAATMISGAAMAAATPNTKILLTCKFGQAMEQDHMLDIANNSATTLKTETIINLDIKATGNGEAFDCFALTAPLAGKGHISHMEKITVGGTPTVCTAFVSSKTPAIVHGSDGSSMTQCDY